MARDSLATTTLGSGPAVVLLHGFAQSGRCWGPIPKDLASRYHVAAVDLPGHGRSTPRATGMAETTDAVLAVGGPATYVGYSMGARVALYAALHHPQFVHRLVLISGSPGIEDADERAARVAFDQQLADHILDVGVEVFLREWLAGPLFAHLPGELRDEDERRRNTAAGLAESLRQLGTGTQDSLWARLPELTMPVLIVVGEHDHKFTAIGRRMAEQIGPNAEFVALPGGHLVHRECTEFTPRLIEWLDRTNP